MKKIITLCLFLSSLSVYADTVITESMEARGRSIPVTLKIKGDKIRIDASPMMSTVTDISTGDILSILHAQKSYMKISGEQARALMQMKKAAATPSVKPKFVDTGKSEKVGPFNTGIYTLDTPTATLTFWVTKDIPGEVLEKLKKLRSISNAGVAGASSPDTSDLQGYPVKIQIVKEGQTTTITILSLEEKPVDDSEMTPPAGYTEISMPSHGGAGPGQPKP